MSATYGLYDFIDDVRDILAREQPPDVALERLTPGFKRLLANRTFLTQQLKDIGIRSDEVCLHAESDDGFVVLARFGRSTGSMRAARTCSAGRPTPRSAVGHSQA